MTDKVKIACVVYNESTGLFNMTPFWRDFVHKATLEDRSSDEILADYNARHIDYGIRTWFVEFETESDLLDFILRWS